MNVFGSNPTGPPFTAIQNMRAMRKNQPAFTTRKRRRAQGRCERKSRATA